MKALPLAALLAALSVLPAHAADRGNAHEADLAVKSAQVETLRARAAVHPSATTTPFAACRRRVPNGAPWRSGGVGIPEPCPRPAPLWPVRRRPRRSVG